MTESGGEVPHQGPVANHKELISKYETIEVLNRNIKELINKVSGVQSIWSTNRNYIGRKKAEETLKKTISTYEVARDDALTLLEPNCHIKRKYVTVSQNNTVSSENRVYLNWNENKEQERTGPLSDEDWKFTMFMQTNWEKDVIWDVNQLNHNNIERDFHQRFQRVYRNSWQNLVNTRWEDNVIYDADEVDSTVRVNHYLLDTTEPHNDIPEPRSFVRISSRPPKEATFSRKRVFFATNPLEQTRKILKRSMGTSASSTQVNSTKDPYNISNDEYYTPKRGHYHFQRIRPPTGQPESEESDHEEEKSSNAFDDILFKACSQIIATENVRPTKESKIRNLIDSSSDSGEEELTTSVVETKKTSSDWHTKFRNAERLNLSESDSLSS